MTPIATGSTATDARLPADLVARFAAALARLSPGGGPVGLAVSGGPDSMAMLLLAHAAIPGHFVVATVDHGLRPEAAGECALVASHCAAFDVDCVTLTVEVEGGNLQAAARQARYAALGSWVGQRGLRALATAHHADDQAETLLMRLNRGSGVAGLAGVRERGAIEGLGTPVIRPLLRFRRSELARVVEAAGIRVAHDPSNEDERFDRVRMRKALAETDWLDPLALTETANHLAEADEALEHFADLASTLHVTCADGAVRFEPRVPRAIRLRVIARIISRLGGAPRGGDVARLLDRLEAGDGGNVGGVLASCEGDCWIFRPEPPRRST